MQIFILLSLLCLICRHHVSAFGLPLNHDASSPSRQFSLAANSNGNLSEFRFDSIFNIFSARKPPASSSGNVNGLIKEVLGLVATTNRGCNTTPEQFSRIKEIITKLVDENTVLDSATRYTLNGSWDVQWTDEKEILFLIKSGLFGLSTGSVYQEINIKANKLSNVILFGEGNDPGLAEGYLEVLSSAWPDPTSGKVSFMFSGCTLKWKGIKIPLPPVGKGFFETLYLDKNLRITKDSRGDLQILTRRK